MRAALESALRGAVRTGRLGAGTRLPSSRALAADLGVARNTVAEAYGQLVAEGWLTARQGSGTRVAQRPARRSRARRPPRVPRRAVPRYDLRAGAARPVRVPAAGLAGGRPQVARGRSRHALGYGDPRGLPQLRAALADYLARARGVTATPDRIVICSGFTQGLALLCRVLRGRGARARSPWRRYGHRPTATVAAAAGLRPAPLPVDGMGAVVGAGRRRPTRCC